MFSLIPSAEERTAPKMMRKLSRAMPLTTGAKAVGDQPVFARSSDPVLGAGNGIYFGSRFPRQTKIGNSKSEGRLRQFVETAQGSTVHPQLFPIP